MNRSSELRVQKHLYNYMISCTDINDELKTVGFFDEFQVRLTKDDEISIAAKKTSENIDVWNKFMDIYKRTADYVHVEDVKINLTNSDEDLLNKIQENFQCLCVKSSDEILTVFCQSDAIWVDIKNYINRCNAACVLPTSPVQKQTFSIPPPKEPASSSVTLPVGYDVCGKLKVYIHVHDVTTLRVSAIVNAANHFLVNESGVARVIKEKAGPAFQEDCKKVLREKSKRMIPVTEVVCTIAGDLPCGYVLHAVGPKWPQIFTADKESKCLIKLRKTFNTVLQLSVDKQLSNIAIIPVSSGKYKVPSHHVADAMLSAIVNFAHDCTSTFTPEVHLVDKRYSLVESVARLFCDLDVPGNRSFAVRRLLSEDVKAVITSVIDG